MNVLVGFDGSPHAAAAITVGAALFPTRDGLRRAEAAGWTAEPAGRRGFAGEGLDLALAAARRLWPSREHVVASVACSAAQDLAPDGGLVRAVLTPKGVPETARSVADALAGHAGGIGAAVIVVGSRGRSAHREVLLGSVAMATLHHAHRPVLAVPPPPAASEVGVG